MAPKRRMKAKLREDRQEATVANETWATDSASLAFGTYQLATGRKLRVLTIVETWSRYSPTVGPRYSYRGEDVVRTLEAICGQIGYPKTIRVDQGTESVSHDFDLWAY